MPMLRGLRFAVIVLTVRTFTVFNGRVASTISIRESFLPLPTRRISAHKSKLPAREQAICLRIKEARIRLGLSQEAAAERIGVLASQLSNLEKGRAPVRCDLALRLCRQLIISEEWLATGKHEILETHLQSTAPIAKGTMKWWEAVFFRQSAALWGNSVLARVPARALFSEAWEGGLSDVFTKTSAGQSFLPMFRFSESDDPELTTEFLRVLIDRWRLIFRLECAGLSWDEAKNMTAENQLLKMFIDAVTAIFARSIGLMFPAGKLSSFSFLRTLLDDETTPIGPLSEVIIASKSKRAKGREG